MRVLTNPGSNLPRDLVRAYDIVLAPQRIAIGGQDFDMREGMTIAEMEAHIHSSSTHPFVLGSSASELATLFAECTKKDPDLVAIMSSRTIVGSYTACLSAARVLKASASGARANVHVIDTGCTDVGAGLASLVAAQGARAGLSMTQVVSLVEAFCSGGTFSFIVADAEYLKRSKLTYALPPSYDPNGTVRPVVSFVNGGLTPTGFVARSNHGEGLVDLVAARVAKGRAVWVGIAHAGRSEEAQKIDALLRRRFDVKYCLERELTIACYQAFGPGCLALFVAPVDALPWTPQAP